MAVVALAATIGSCGSAGGGKDTTARTTSAAGSDGSSHTATGTQRKHRPFTLDTDGDYDNEGKGWYDPDDAKTFDYGQAADTGDRREVTTLVKRYYAAAAADDGALACSLTYWVVAEVLAEEYAGEEEAPCPSGAARLFRRMHRRFATDAAAMRVTGVRVEGERGLALVSFGNAPTRYVIVHRQGHTWRIYYPFDAGLS